MDYSNIKIEIKNKEYNRDCPYKTSTVLNLFLTPPQCTKIDFRGSFRGARVKIEYQDKTNIDFFPYSGTTGFRSNF